MASRKPLEGIRVLDLTQAYSGPFCTMNLADFGAEVIKIERPGTGDQTRTWGPFKNDYSAYFAYINRNKQGVTLDLSTAEGKDVFASCQFCDAEFSFSPKELLAIAAKKIEEN